MLQQVINNTLRRADGYRELAGWDVPVTTAEDLSLALKCVRNAAPHDYGATVTALGEIGREAEWITHDHLRELAQRTGSPISFLTESISRVNVWLASVERYVSKFGEPDGTVGYRGDAAIYQGGLPTAMILAGDSTALTAWALGQALLSGSPLIVKPSNVEPLSAFLFVRAVVEKGIRAPNLLFLDSSSAPERELIRKALRACAQSVVFGEDATVRAVHESFVPPPEHKAIAYWTGRSGAVVFDDADLDRAARSIVRGAVLDRGNMCNSTKKAFVPRRVQAQFEHLLVDHAERIRHGDPLDPDTELGRLDPVARGMAERSAAGTRIFYDHGVIFAECHDASPLITEEIAYPIVGIRYYDRAEDPIALANASVREAPSGRALAMSVFATDEEAFERALALRACKILRNAPSADVDHFETHQGMHLMVELMRPMACPMAASN